MTKKDIMCICGKCLKDISTCGCTYDTEIKDIGTLSAIIRNVKHHNEQLKSDLQEKELLLSKAQDRISKLETSPDFSNVSGQLFEEAVDFGKWLLKNVIYDSRKYYNLRENIGEFDKDDIYEVCELYTIWKETLK